MMMLRLWLLLGTLALVVMLNALATLQDSRIERFCAGLWPDTWRGRGIPEWATEANTERLCTWVPRVRGWLRLPTPCDDRYRGCL